MKSIIDALLTEGHITGSQRSLLTLLSIYDDCEGDRKDVIKKVIFATYRTP